MLYNDQQVRRDKLNFIVRILFSALALYIWSMMGALLIPASIQSRVFTSAASLAPMIPVISINVLIASVFGLNYIRDKRLMAQLHAFRDQIQLQVDTFPADRATWTTLHILLAKQLTKIDKSLDDAQQHTEFLKENIHKGFMRTTLACAVIYGQDQKHLDRATSAIVGATAIQCCAGAVDSLAYAYKTWCIKRGETNNRNDAEPAANDHVQAAVPNLLR